jgi:hypothetical protein
MKRSLKLTTAIAALLSVPSAYAIVCTNFPADTQDPNQGYVATLGIGIDSERGNRIKPLSCLNFTTRQVGTPNATYELLMTRSLEEYMRSVSQTRGGGFKIFGFGFGKSKTITSIHLQKRYSSTLVLDYSAYLGSRVIEIDGNTPLTDQANRVRNDYCKFKQQCGDEVVMQQEEGASVKFALRFSFTSEYYSNGFNKNFNLGFSNPAIAIPCTPVKIPKDSISFSLSRMAANASSSLKNNGRVEVFAFQEGGDVLALGRALGATNHNENAPIVECGLNNLAACDEAMSKIINYIASDEFIDGVKNQPAQLATHTRKLTEIDVTLPDSFRESEITPAIAQAREDLQNEYLQRYEDFLRAEETLQLSLSPARSQQVRMLRDTLGNELAAIQATALTCYSDLANCAAQTQQTLAGFLAYDRAAVLPNTADGLVAYYPFNGNALDESGNGNDGVVHGNTLVADRENNTNSAYSFNSSSYIGIPHNNSFNPNTFTIIGWIYRTRNCPVVADSCMIFNKEDRYELGIRRGNTLQIGHINSSSNTDSGWFNTNIVIPELQWIFIAFQYDGTYVTVHMNDASSVSTQARTTLRQSTYPFLIGQRSKYVSSPYAGILDDIRIYNRALTVAEIQHLYQTTETKLNQTPLALFTTSATQDTAPFSVNLDASTASDADGSIVSYQWQTDTGQSASGKTATLTFPQAGTYQLTLTVTDDQGATSQAVKSITVESASGGNTGSNNQNLTVYAQTGGKVISTGINCGDDCNEAYPLGSTVTLWATPDAGYTFKSWAIDCIAETSDTCTVTMDADKTVGAAFELARPQPNLTVQVSGAGSVSGTGITCGLNGTDCTQTYAPNTQVTLSASPDKDYTFQGWSGGGCSGTGSCTVNMSVDTNVTATFSTTSSSNSARLTNISTRPFVGNGLQNLITGFVITGTGTKNLVVRAKGQGLLAAGVPTSLDAQVNLVTYPARSFVTKNTSWGAGSQASQLQSLGLAPEHSTDAADLLDLPAGAYTAEVSPEGASGIGLIEVFESPNATGDSRLSNISTRAFVGSGLQNLIAGFAIEGDGKLKLVLRALGQGLVSAGVATNLDARIQVYTYPDRKLIASNDSWGSGSSASELQSLNLAPPHSSDAALIMELGAGAYTVEVVPVSTTGIGLIEVFEAP